MEEAKQTIKNFFTKLKKKRKRFLKLLILLVIVVVFLAGSTYDITIEDGTYKEKDWSSIPYAAGEYVKEVSVKEDGTLESKTTAQDLWDKMQKEKSRVGEYLKSPEELARLMKAEIVTQYPDTRPYPNSSIDWDKVIEDPNALQGIIKFKRAKTDGNIDTMTYVEPETLYEWIELYIETGEKKYKDLALTHFTLAKNDLSESTSNNNWNSNEPSPYTTNDLKTNKSDAIVKAAKSTRSPGKGLCQKWVRLVYAKAGLGNASYLTAYKAYKANCVSKRKDNIPIGAAVYGTGSGTGAGHVGIYIGNGMVMDNVGSIKTQTLEEWIAWQERKPTSIPGVKPGWLGWGWQSGSPKIISGTNEQNTEEEKENTQKQEESTKEQETEEDNNQKEENQEETKTEAQGYCAVVATWEQIDTLVTSNDSNVEQQNTTLYTMTTTNINYEEMVKSYTMPFDLLWQLLVIGEDKNFIFELTDLIYNSDIQITVHDNLTVNTDIDQWNYTKETKAEVDATITANCVGKTATESIKNDVHDDPPYESVNYTTTKTVVTQTNTLDIALTKANVWVVDYTKEYTYNSPETEKINSQVTEENTKYPNQPSRTGNSFSCEHINAIKERLSSKVQTAALQDPSGMPTIDGDPLAIIEGSVHFEENINAKYYDRYVDIVDNVTNIEKTQKYVAGTPDIQGKIDEKTEPNFVTIFKKPEYRNNKSNIKSAASWLFKLMRENENTEDKLDLIKYLLYKATNHNYGVTEYEFDEFEPASFSDFTGIYGNTIQEKVWFALKGLGYSDVSVAGAMGNIDLESGGFKAGATEKGGTGIGLIQWSFGRADQLRKYAKHKGTKWQDEDTQIEFLVTEISGQGPAKGYATQRKKGWIGNERVVGTYKQWANAKTIEDATLAFMRYFESPASKSTYNQDGTWGESRLKRAKKYLKEFQGREAPTAVMGGGSSLQVAKGTSAQKLKFLFPNGTPTTQSQTKRYMATVDIPITTKTGKKTTMKLTIHKQLVADVQDVFRTAQAGGFKIYEAYGYSFRRMNNGGSGKLSHHSYGVAIDINVKENYSHRGGTVYAGSFWNPKKSPYSIPRNGILEKAFKAKGWKWGGNWSGNYQDYMHFSFTGH